MAAPTTYFVDPGIAGNSGTGTVVDPYGDLKFAIDSNSWDATNGVKLCVKSGTAEVVTEDIDNTLGTNGWTPSQTVRLLIRGYTATEDDGGVCTLDGGGSVSIFNSATVDGVMIIDAILQNTGTAQILRLDDNNYFGNVTFQTCTHIEPVRVSGNNIFFNCYFVGLGATGTSSVLKTDQENTISFCFFDTRGVTNAPDFVVNFDTNGNLIADSIIACDDVTIGIACNGGNAHNCVIIGNTVFSNGGTGKGILARRHSTTIINNYIEGFSGTGGIGFEIESAADVMVYAGNRFYNNATNETLTGDILVDRSIGADILSSSGLTAPGSDNYTPTSDLEDVGYPTTYPSIAQATGRNVGAVQNDAAVGGAGGLLTHPGMTGGTRG